MKFEFTQSDLAREYLINYGIEPASVIKSWSDSDVVQFANHKHEQLNPSGIAPLTWYQMHGLPEPEPDTNREQDRDKIEDYEAQRIKR